MYAVAFNLVVTAARQGLVPKSVRDIRAFRIEQWSDFTALVKSYTPPILNRLPCAGDLL